MTTTVEHQASLDAPANRRGLDPRIGWALVALLTLVVLATWSPSLSEGLGDNHEGRILGRHALHVTNAQEKGLAGSGWLSDASPYLSSYSHHPPLLNLGYYLTSVVLPVETDLAMRIFAYLIGVGMVPVGAALLRRLGFGFAPILLAAGALAVTPLFWSYGRLHGNVTLLLAMALVAVRFREDRDIPTWELVVGTLIATAAVVAGYLGLAAGALLGLWVLAKRRLDRVTVVLGIGLVLGAAITALYVIGNSGASNIGSQLELRTVGGEFTREQFVLRMERWREELLPAWWRQALTPIAIAAGLFDRRTRVLVVITGVVSLGYVYGLQQGAFIHDYWIFPLVLPVWIGTAALVATVTEHAQRWLSAVLVTIAAGALVLQLQGLLTGPIPDEYFRDREAGGTLVREVAPPEGQTAAWALPGIAGPRWFSFYWDLPFHPIGHDDLPLVPDDDLVLLRLDRVPDWADRDEVADAAVEREGIYVLVPGRDLRAAADTAAAADAADAGSGGS